MKLHIHLTNDAPLHLTSLQLFDFYYAYLQSKNKDNNYQTDTELKISHEFDPEPGALRIGFYNRPAAPVEHDKYDIILLNADGLGLDSCTKEIHHAVTTYDNCYFITAAYVDRDHPLADKIIYTPYFIHTRDWMSRPLFPQFYDREARPKQAGKNLIYINGANRPHRQYMADILTEVAGSLVDIRHNSAFSKLTELNPWETFFETAEDTAFRKFVDRHCGVEGVPVEMPRGYYERSIAVGIDGRQGRIPPGYFILDEYWDYHCVIFPETTWYNDSIMVTEKICKPAITRTIPWPISGANTDTLYNQLGLKTAWNLLPQQLQLYNYERDHVQRHQMCVEAIKWVGENPEILTGPEAQAIVEHNYTWFFSNTIETIGPKQLDKIIQEYQP